MHLPRLLAKTPAFAHLVEEDLCHLASWSQWRSFSAGEVLMEAGAPADRFGVLLSGVVVLDGGTDELPETLEEGDLIGFEAVLEGEPQPAQVRALTAGRAIEMQAAPFLEHMETRFDMMLGLLAAASARLRGSVHRITEMKVRSTAHRLASYLLELAEAGERKSAGGPVRLILPYGKQVLAVRLGMQPESLSRAFGKLRPYGVATGRNEAVRIDDLDVLAQFCHRADGELDS